MGKYSFKMSTQWFRYSEGVGLLVLWRISSFQYTYVEIQLNNVQWRYDRNQQNYILRRSVIIGLKLAWFLFLSHSSITKLQRRGQLVLLTIVYANRSSSHSDVKLSLALFIFCLFIASQHLSPYDRRKRPAGAFDINLHGVKVLRIYHWSHHKYVYIHVHRNYWR